MREYGIYDTNRYVYFLSSCCAVNSAKGGGGMEKGKGKESCHGI